MVPVGLLLLHVPTQSSAIKCNANSWNCLRNRHWLINKLATNKTIERKRKKKRRRKKKKQNDKKRRKKKNQSDNGCTYLFLEPKMKRKEKHLWQLSFPFLCFHFGTFCPFSQQVFSVAQTWNCSLPETEMTD